MAGTYEGGVKAREKNLARNPNHYKEIGAKGGSRKNTGGGFAANVDCKCDLIEEAHYKRNCAGKRGGLVKGELYKRNKVFQEYVPPASKEPVEEAPKRRFALWGR